MTFLAVTLGVAHAIGCQKADVPKEAPAEEPSTPIGAEATPDRTVLPIREPDPPVYTELDVRDATPPPRRLNAASASANS